MSATTIAPISTGDIRRKQTNDVMRPCPVEDFKRETADIGGVRLHYWVGGNPAGPPVLLWHGFLSTGRAWRKVMPLLASAGYAVLVPDMRGYGDSDKPAGTNGYDACALANEFRALVHQIGFGRGKPLLLAAHDMGAHPALLWAADHPEEVAGLLYMEVPTMLSEVLTKIIAYTPEAMKSGALWWWILPLAPGVPERLIVGNERAFLTWFYDGATADRTAIEPAAIEETLRTFCGNEGVLGALGVYRAAFTTIAQTEPLKANKVKVPVVALGGDKALGAGVQEMAALVAENITGVVVTNCGHFIPEERPDEVVRQIQAMARETAQSPS
jgi:pimeloyl-ACP methyl ester carboxylesterase